MTKEMERRKMVLAMEFIARQVNDEMVFERWLYGGVADGDIDYGETDTDAVDEYYIEDEHFRDLMDTFLRMMASAKKNGGLYSGGITSNEG